MSLWRTHSALRRGLLQLLLGLAAGLLGPGTCNAKTWAVGSEGKTLSQVLSLASPGDLIKVKAGLHPGSIIIDKPLVLEGEPKATISGEESGRVVIVDAPDVTIRGLTIKGSGSRLDTEDSGIFVTQNGDRAHIEHNQIIGNLIGIYLKGPKDAVVIRNRIHGREDLRLNERGNGIQLWNTPGSIIEDNEISAGRDGIFVTTSKHNIFKGNRISNVRFAVHYMYTNDSEVSWNRSAGNHLGYAIMYSNRIRMVGNRSLNDRDHGILLNYANNSEIENNIVRHGANKCVFIYNANKNKFSGNLFEGCNIGIHFTAGSERNSVTQNAFIANRTQVKYVGTRFVEWSENGRGNYWSDNLAFDVNGDGIADYPYKPNDIVDQIIWRHPVAKLLLTSPAMQILKFAQSIFPALDPGGVQDSAPLMSPPSIELTEAH